MKPTQIFKRKKQAYLTVLAVGISVVLLISMKGIADGIFHNTLDDINKSKSDIVISGSNHGIVNGHSISSSISAMPEVNRVFASLTDVLAVRAPGRGVKYAMAQGLVPEDAQYFFTEEDRKRFPDEGCMGFSVPDDPHASGGAWTYEVLVDSNLARDLKIQKGDQIGLSRNATGAMVTFNVTGVFKSELQGRGITAGVYFVVLHLSELQSLLGLRDSDAVDSLYLNLRSDVRTDQSQVEDLRKTLEDMYPFYDIATKKDQIKKMEERMAMAEGFYTAIGMVSLMIGLLFVGCIMVISVVERTREIGIMRAMGISRKSIFIQIFGESSVLVLLGGLLGIPLGMAVGTAMSDYFASAVGVSETLVYFSPASIAYIYLEVVSVGALVSLLPAWMAMKMDIVSAMKGGDA